jgi:hypothetical protein
MVRLTAKAKRMNTFHLALRRELRVACSRRAQPVWFCIVKWTCLLAGIAWLHDRRWFWWTLASLAVAAMFLHFFYRWKTRIWIRGWGGWTDPAAGRD